MTYPDKIDLSVLDNEPTYRGSVQDLFTLEADGSEYFLCRTSESGSVFDVGTIFSVPESDVLRTAVRHHIYTSMENPDTWKEIGENEVKRLYKSEVIVKDLADNPLLSELREKGMSTHHVGMVCAKTGNQLTKRWSSIFGLNNCLTATARF